MKIFVVCGFWDYEGYDEPIGVYSSIELAEKAISVAYKKYDEIVIEEYELDEIFVWPDTHSDRPSVKRK